MLLIQVILVGGVSVVLCLEDRVSPLVASRTILCCARQDTANDGEGKAPVESDLEGDAFYLRRNPALQVPIKLVEDDPKLPDILKRLRQATGLSLELDGNLGEHAPDFGSVQLDTVPAFSVMELVAATDLEGGQWVKTENGYRLVGTPSAGSKARALQASSSPFLLSYRAWLVGISLTALAGITTALIVFTWRRRMRGAGMRSRSCK